MVGRVEVVEVEVVGLQTREAFVDGAENGFAREAVLVRRVAHLEEDFAGQDDLVAAALERVAEQRFRDTRVVHVGGVEEVDAGVEAAVDDLVGARLIERLAEGHGAEAEAGDVEVGVGKGAVVHGRMISRRSEWLRRLPPSSVIPRLAPKRRARTWGHPFRNS